MRKAFGQNFDHTLDAADSFVPFDPAFDLSMASVTPDMNFSTSWSEASLTSNAVYQTPLAANPAELSGGLTFSLVNTGGVAPGSQAEAGFMAAAALWSGYLTDAVTIRLNVGFTTLGANVLGQAGSEAAIVTYSALRTALVADATSSSDAAAVASLGLGSSLSFYTNNSAGTRVYDADGSANNALLQVSTANLKALGITRDANGNVVDDGVTADASITFNSSFTFDFDRSNGITAGAIDFVGVAFHEIGHALGFTSGVDIVDYYSGTGAGPATDLNPYAIFSTLDLFRYSSNGVRDLSYGTNSYFSINSGASNLGRFSTGDFHGDGNQASHWKDNLGLGIMDPTSAPAGQANVITALDLQAIDVIGWNLASAASPGTVTINDASVSEGNAGTKAMLFTVTRASGTAAFSVNYATSNNTAMAGSDYVAASGTLNFAIGETSKTISITINGDTAAEASETFYVLLSGATNGATISDSQGLGTITNDDAAPDLNASLNMGSMTVAAGGTLAIDEYTKNLSIVAAGATTTSFYLSIDATINTSDLLLTTKSTAALAAYGTGTAWYDRHEFSLQIATGLAAGTYYLGAIADAGGQFAEVNEANNVSNTVQITVTSPADLIGNLYVPTTTVRAGASLILDEYTKNFGHGAAAASSASYYLSTDATIDSSDVLLATRPTSALAGYGTGTSWYHHDTFSVTFSSNLTSGTYYLGAMADSGNAIGELSETNNVWNVVQIQVTVAPAAVVDLNSSLNMGAKTVAAGGTLTIDEYTKNLSTNAAGATTTSFYLSADATIDTSDLLITSKSVASLAAYGTGTAWYDRHEFSQQLSTGLAAGTYYLGAIADADGKFAETNEANNLSNTVQITVTAPADLIGNLYVPTTVARAGTSITLDEYTKNFGYGEAAASSASYYLSTDASIDTSDLLLATRPTAALAGYGTGTSWYHHDNFSVTLSSGLADGTYYLGAMADSGNTIGELNEANNVWNVVQIVIDHNIV